MDKIEKLLLLAADETKAGNYDKAIEAYEEVISMCTETEQAVHLAHWGIGEIYLDNHKYEKAKYHLNKAIELAPNEAGYHYLLGCTCRYTEEIDQSIHHLQKAVELDDSRDIFWCELGWVMGHFRDADKGIEYLKKAMKLNSSNAKTLTDMAMLYASQNKWNEALLCIEEAANHDPDNRQIIEIEERIHFFKNEFERLAKCPDVREAS